VVFRRGRVYGGLEPQAPGAVADEFELAVVVHHDPRVVPGERDVGKVEVVDGARVDPLDRTAEVVRTEAGPESAGIDFAQHAERRLAARRSHDRRFTGDDGGRTVAHDRAAACRRQVAQD